MDVETRILIVEDQRLVAEDIRKSLEQLRYTVADVVSSGAEAVQVVQNNNVDHYSYPKIFIAFHFVVPPVDLKWRPKTSENSSLAIKFKTRRTPSTCFVRYFARYCVKLPSPQLRRKA